MNAVGVDVSKGKSTVAFVQPFGVVIAQPFEVSHNEQELKELAERIKRLPGETKVVMEYTGSYYEPIANALHNEGIFVSVVNPLLIDDYGTNRVRKVKTDKKDSLKIANYALDRWLDLREYILSMTYAKRLKLLISNIFSTTKFLLCKKIILSLCLIPAFPMPINCFHLPKDNLTDTRSGLILF